MIERLLQAERALSVGLLDRAETLYRQVADADPRNSIAVVGLARVTLERDDEAGALTLARRALTIDPENSAAQRMVQRLEEVIEYRGEALPVPVAPAPPIAPATAEVAVASEAPAEPPIAPALAPAPAPAPAPQPATTTEYPPANQPNPQTATPPPAPPRRRSWLDRLLRRR